MPERHDALRLAIYRSFAVTGRPPTHHELAGVTTNVPAGLAELHRARHIVLDADGNIAMAHPFSSINLGFSVMSVDTLWFGGCAWDSFALPHVLTDIGAVLVATTCPACGRALAWNVNTDGPPTGDELAHFLVPVEHMWDDVVDTCGNQRIFCGRSCIDDWLASTAQDEGYIMDLAQLWRLASGWYAGRLDPGYERRDPAEAAQYFRSVGLSGPFWGL